MSSESLYLIRKPKNLTPFDEAVTVQKVSRDLIIYSALAGQIVKVAWLVYFQLLMSRSSETHRYS